MVLLTNALGYHVSQVPQHGHEGERPVVCREKRKLFNTKCVSVCVCVCVCVCVHPHTFNRPMSFSQVMALFPSWLSLRSHVSGRASFMRCPALSLSQVPVSPLWVNAFMSLGYLKQRAKQVMSLDKGLSLCVCVCVCVPLSQYSHDMLGWLLDVEFLDKCLQIELALLLIDHQSLR